MAGPCIQLLESHLCCDWNFPVPKVPFSCDSICFFYLCLEFMNRVYFHGWVGCQPFVYKKLLENQVFVVIDIRNVAATLVLTLKAGWGRTWVQSSIFFLLNHPLRTKMRESCRPCGPEVGVYKDWGRVRESGPQLCHLALRVKGLVGGWTLVIFC